MIKSMTGYGRGECILYDRKLVVEIKSVNHRYNDINIRLPRVLNPFEDRLRKNISQFIFRGKTDVYVNLESFSKDDIKINLNEALADAYVEQLRIIKERFNFADDVSLSILTRFHDILSVEKFIDDESALTELWQTLNEASDQAIEQIIRMRRAEGEALKNDILDKLDLIAVMVSKITERAGVVPQEYAQKLKARLSDIMESYQIDESRILGEIAVFADRACIDEELARLGSHLKQMATIFEESDPVGRKLDFLVQEINREVNTIGSKANDLEITRITVDLKSEVEKIREQVQNIE